MEVKRIDMPVLLRAGRIDTDIARCHRVIDLEIALMERAVNFT